MNSETKQLILWRREIERDLVASKRLTLWFLASSFKSGPILFLGSLGIVWRAYFRNGFRKAGKSELDWSVNRAKTTTHLPSAGRSGF